MSAQKFLVNRHRSETGRRFQKRNDLHVEDVGQRIRTAPTALDLVLRGKRRGGLQPVTGRLANPGLCSRYGHGMGLSERHGEPHLLVGDMTARHERSPATERSSLIRASHDRQTHPFGAKRWGATSPV